MPQNKNTARRMLQIAGVALLAIVTLYLAVQFYVIFNQSYKTETAIRYTMSDSVSLQGVVYFDTVKVQGSGDLGYLVSDGERVTNGTVVAECYTESSQGLLRERLDRLHRTINLLTKSQNSTGSDLSVLTNQTRQALYNLLDKLDTAQYSGITDAEDEFLQAQNRLQVSTGQVSGFDSTIAALQQEYDEVKAKLDTLQTVKATTIGYFTGTDAMPTVAVDGAALADADAAALQQILTNGLPAADTTDCAGQIATGFGWLFYTVCDAETAARFQDVGTVGISIPGKQNTPLSATVKELTPDKETGLAKLVLECQTVNADILSLGIETARIDLKTYEGIRLDKAALHIVEGNRGVYVKYGNLQRFLKITILYEDENYLLIPADGQLGTDNEVRLYDEIIVQGKNLQDGKLI